MAARGNHEGWLARGCPCLFTSRSRTEVGFLPARIQELAAGNARSRSFIRVPAGASLHIGIAVRSGSRCEPLPEPRLGLAGGDPRGGWLLREYFLARADHVDA